MIGRLGRLDLGSTGLAALAGASICMGLIQLLAAPLDQVANVNVQDVAVQTTLLIEPVLLSLLLLLRDGPAIVSQGARLAHHHPRWMRQLWWQQAPALGLNMISLLPYTLAAALLAAMVTRPELDSLAELSQTIGALEPLMLVFSLIKTAVFALASFWIALYQGARARRRGLPQAAGLSRAITVTLAVVLLLDLTWALAIDPLISGAGV